MSVFDDEQTLHNLEEERAAIENGPHNGYTDATRFVRLESEIESLEERVSQERQQAEHGEG